MRAIAAKSVTCLSSRRFGKTDGGFGPTLWRDAQHMPMGATAIYQATYKQLYGRTIPSSLQFLERYNIREGIHFTFGKAPRNLGFDLPKIQPRKTWDNVMHWYNGHVTHLLSQDVKFSANSLTLDGLKIDEGRSIKKDKFYEEVVPALSGTPGLFEKCPWKKGIQIYSDMPTNKEGLWIKDMEKGFLDPDNQDLMAIIETLLFERAEILNKYGENLNQFPAALNRLKQIKLELNHWRKHTFLFVEYDSIENLEILGEDYIKEQKRILSPVVFYSSIMNKLIRRQKGGFYGNIDPYIHYYTADDTAFFDSLRTKRNTPDIKLISSINDCRQDADIDKNQHLSIALDYNSNINWVVTGQRRMYQARILSSMYTKHERKLRQVIRDWCKYYKFHPVKTVVYYYNQQALDGGWADEQGQNWKQIVEEELLKAEWFVLPVYMGKQWNHQKKHQVINDALRGEPGLLVPMLNRDRNEHLIPALEMAGTKIGAKGFQKDKTGEKLAETDDDPLELRTDGTDAFDDLYQGLQYYPQEISVVVPLTRMSN